MVGMTCPPVGIGLTETPNSVWFKPTQSPPSPPANDISDTYYYTTYRGRFNLRYTKHDIFTLIRLNPTFLLSIKSSGNGVLS